MGTDSSQRRRSTESRIAFTLLGVVVWVVTGFGVGLVAGIISEDPGLLVDHATGKSTEIEWSGGKTSRMAALASLRTPDVAAPPDEAKAVEGDSRLTPASEPKRIRKNPPAAVIGGVPQAAPDVAAKRAPRYLIQVGAYGSRGAAAEVAETLRGRGYEVQVLKAADDGRWRVRVGPVVERQRAEGLARRLKTEDGMPTWILREQPS